MHYFSKDGESLSNPLSLANLASGATALLLLSLPLSTAAWAKQAPLASPIAPVNIAVDSTRVLESELNEMNQISAQSFMADLSTLLAILLADKVAHLRPGLDEPESSFKTLLKDCKLRGTIAQCSKQNIRPEVQFYSQIRNITNHWNNTSFFTQELISTFTSAKPEKDSVWHFLLNLVTPFQEGDLDAHFVQVVKSCIDKWMMRFPGELTRQKIITAIQDGMDGLKETIGNNKKCVGDNCAGTIESTTDANTDLSDPEKSNDKGNYASKGRKTAPAASRPSAGKDNNDAPSVVPPLLNNWSNHQPNNMGGSRGCDTK